MNQPKTSGFIIFTGVTCVLFALIMALMAFVMYALETPLSTCIIIGFSAAFPLLGAVACFLPSKRSISLRIIGAVVCMVGIGTLYQTFFSPGEDDKPRIRKVGMLIVVTVGSGLMAWKGKWPSDETDAIDQSDTPS